jgi:hypothetical protein
MGMKAVNNLKMHKTNIESLCKKNMPINERYRQNQIILEA